MTPSHVRDLLRELREMPDLSERAHAIIETLLLEMGEHQPEEIPRQEFEKIHREVKAASEVLRTVEKARRDLSLEQAGAMLLEKIRTSARKRRPPLGAPYGRGSPQRPREKDDPRLAEIGREIMARIREAARRRRKGGV